METIKKLNLEWEKLIERQIELGLSRKEFCKQENLGIHAFSYHKGKYLQKKNLGQSDHSRKEFVELQNNALSKSDVISEASNFAFYLKIDKGFFLEIRLG
jgi:aryl-alcohol dehydrogenase-like predicted oxidoreductase